MPPAGLDALDVLDASPPAPPAPPALPKLRSAGEQEAASRSPKEDKSHAAVRVIVDLREGRRGYATAAMV